MAPVLLVIDDHPQINELVRAIFVAQGYQVETAQTSRSGLELVRTLKPAVVLIDLKLSEPYFTGWQVIAIIKNTPDLRDIPVIAFSALNMPRNINRAFSAGCDAFIGKPFSPRELVALVQEMVRTPPPAVAG